jgi:hypothetical protein
MYRSMHMAGARRVLGSAQAAVDEPRPTGTVGKVELGRCRRQLDQFTFLRTGQSDPYLAFQAKSVLLIHGFGFESLAAHRSSRP